VLLIHIDHAEIVTDIVFGWEVISDLQMADDRVTESSSTERSGFSGEERVCKAIQCDAPKIHLDRSAEGFHAEL